MSLTPLRLAAYALPAFALAALYLPLFSYLAPFYSAERGVDLATIGAILIAIRLFDAFSDPAMGILSDRTPQRFGRRRIWLAAAVPVIVLSAWQVFVPPEGAGAAHLALWLTVLTLGWTMAQTPYAAWGAEIAPDYDGRTRVTSWREAVVLVGTVSVVLVYVGAGTGSAGLWMVALLVTCALPIGVAAAYFSVPDRSGTMDAPQSLRQAFRAISANGPFRWLLGAWFLNGLANGLPVTLFEFFARDRLALDTEEFGMVFLAYFVAAILGVPFWTWVARQTSKHRAWCLAMLYACAIFSAALFLERGDVLPYLAISVLTGLALGADLSLPAAIQADVIETDRREHGTERAGLFFAIWQVATKAALALSSGLALITLDVAGFVSRGMNDATALMTLAVLYAGIPILLKLAAVAMMWRFPLDRTAMEGRT